MCIQTNRRCYLSKQMNQGNTMINQLSQSSWFLLTGAVSCEEAVPPLAGAALHPSQDDPGHVHPHFTFTGQLSQHQAVHITMREETGFVPDTCFGRNRHHFLPHHWSTLKRFLSRGTAPEQEGERLHLSPKPQEGHYTDFQEKMDGDGGKGHCRLY